MSLAHRLFSGKHRRRFVLFLVACGFPLVIWCVAVLNGLSYRPGMVPHTVKGKTPIHVSALSSDDRLLIELESRGCFHFTKHHFVFNGATGEATVVLEEDRYGGRSKVPIRPSDKLLGNVALGRNEMEGLDRFLDIIREGGGWCTTIDIVRLNLFKGEKLIASEQFSDPSCIEHSFDEDEKGNLVFRERDLASDSRNSNVLTLAMLIRRLQKMEELETKSTGKAQSDG